MHRQMTATLKGFPIIVPLTVQFHLQTLNPTKNVARCCHYGFPPET